MINKNYKHKQLTEFERIKELKKAIELMKSAGFKEDIVGVYANQLKELQQKQKQNAILNNPNYNGN